MNPSKDSAPSYKRQSIGMRSNESMSWAMTAIALYEQGTLPTGLKRKFAAFDRIQSLAATSVVHEVLEQPHQGL